MRVSTGSLDNGHDVCDSQAAGNWAEGKSVCLHVLHRSPEGVRQFYDGMRACVRPDDGSLFGLV